MPVTSFVVTGTALRATIRSLLAEKSFPAPLKLPYPFKKRS